ncbi:MAG: helix-turn-helix domain-containing protein [Eggerthellaceae bacterium]|nr:helix-turn-helix domain-containing protein [Eggerthellaceae bacterium]
MSARVEEVEEAVQSGAVSRASSASRLKGSSRLTPAQTRILGVIAEKTVSEGGATFSKKELAAEARCDMKTVDRAIMRLRREGYIESDAQYSETGRQLANVYRLKR